MNGTIESVPCRETQVGQQLDNMEMEIERLNRIQIELRERLRPVLTECAGTDKTGPESPPKEVLVPLASRIRCGADAVMNIARSLETTMCSIEV